MFSVVILIILILIIIFIIYTYYYLQEKEIEIISKNNKTIQKNKGEKIISYYTDYLQIKDNKAYVIYYELPLNCIYWTIGCYNDNKCLNSVNMGRYQTTEKGDRLAIIIGNNYNTIKAAKNEIGIEHNKKNPHIILINHSISIYEDFYIHFESYSNKFIQNPKIIIEEYIFNINIFEKFTNIILPISINRKCESSYLFEKSKDGFIDNRCKKIITNIDSNENNISLECLTNKTDIIDIGDPVYKKDENGNDILLDELPRFKLIGVDHFKSRAALHSHVVFFNADTDEPFEIEIISEISDRINSKDTISTRRITFKISENIKRIYVIEYIYYDFVSGNKIHPDSIIPIELYKVI